MSDDLYGNESTEELSTEQLASDVADLRSQLDAMKARAFLRDEVAMQTAYDIAQPHAYVESAPEVAQSFVATTPQLRPALPQISPQQVQDVTAKALSVVASTTNDWSSVAPNVMRRIQDDPSRLSGLVQQGPVATAAYLSSLAQAERASADTRAMKMAAQSASGASGRPSPLSDNEQRWQEIQNAETGRLGL